MMNQFSRTELIFDKEAMERLASSRVTVFGIGGVGGYTVEALIRSGVGAVDLIDDDKVCLTNINRQIYATRKTVGKYKVDVAAEQERLEIVGFYHSHLNSDAVVSEEDILYMIAGFSYPIVSLQNGICAAVKSFEKTQQPDTDIQSVSTY